MGMLEQYHYVEHQVNVRWDKLLVSENTAQTVSVGLTMDIGLSMQAVLNLVFIMDPFKYLWLSRAPKT